MGEEERERRGRDRIRRRVGGREEGKEKGGKGRTIRKREDDLIVFGPDSIHAIP